MKAHPIDAPVWITENVMLLNRGASMSVVAFAGVAQAFGGIPPFNFVKALANAEANVLFVRDPHSKWFGNPVADLGNNPREMAATLGQTLDGLGSSSLCMVGISSGAFAALLFSSLLGRDCRVLAFSPQSSINAGFLASINDRRYDDLLNARLDREFEDVLPCLCAAESVREIHIVLGRREPRDERHCLRLASLPNVALHTLDCGHNTAGQLKKTGQLKSCLHAFLAGQTAKLRTSFAASNAPQASDTTAGELHPTHE
jgi:hypothetical protein